MVRVPIQGLDFDTSVLVTETILSFVTVAEETVEATNSGQLETANSYTVITIETSELVNQINTSITSFITTTTIIT